MSSESGRSVSPASSRMSKRRDSPVPSKRRSRSPRSESGGARSVSSRSILQPISENIPLDERDVPSPRPNSTSSQHSVYNLFTGSDIDLISALEPSSESSIIDRLSLHSVPFHPRSDIETSRRMKEINLEYRTPSAPSSRTADLFNVGAGFSSGSNADGHVVVWGTDLNITKCQERFKEFLLYFNDTSEQIEQYESDSIDHNLSFYLRRLQEIHILEAPFLNVDCRHIQAFDDVLLRQLVSYPQEVIPAFDMAVNQIYFSTYPDDMLPHQIQIRPFSSPNCKPMRSLDPEDIDQLVTVSGMVTRISSIIPEMRIAFFECSVCHNTEIVEIDRGRISEPTVCSHCNTNYSYSLVHNRSTFTDRQIVKLQESPEDMPAGMTPHTILLCVHNDLVDAVQPGDRVEVTGIFRAVSLRVSQKFRNVKSVYKTYIDAVHFKSQGDNCLHEIYDEIGIKFNKERVSKILELSRRSDVYELMAEALAPSIFENTEVKKGILLQLFGGSRKDLSEYGRGHFRSEINILLCGDPGTSKSQLMQYVYKLVPRSQYTSGKGTSAVGLTAYVTKDPETGQHVLQTGALVLADNGVCCIDEFDKMNESTRSILHEVMEQQTLSIAKAGIICQLNARTSVLAAANPVESQWNKHKTIIENIQLPHTLLSRFDLIFLILDPQDELYDRRLASHLVSLYLENPVERLSENLDMDLLRDYIAFAKANVNPKLSEEASQALIHAYVEMRQTGSGRGQICAYPRQLESLIRLAEAHAKVRLSPIVEQLDVAEARRLYQEALKQSSIDPRTGKIDVSILTTGTSVTDRKRRAELTQTLRNIIHSKGFATTSKTLRKDVLFAELRTQAADMPITRDVFEDAINELERSGFITITGQIVRTIS